MKKIEKATFAGGCFWCMVKPFDQWTCYSELFPAIPVDMLKTLLMNK